MTTVHDLAERNAVFAARGFVPGLRINPTGSVMVVGCVDPRVDPAHVLGLRHGEAAVIRNVGGRITPATLRTMTMLARVGQAHSDGRRQSGQRPRHLGTRRRQGHPRGDHRQCVPRVGPGV